jgi:hypothetical protein
VHVDNPNLALHVFSRLSISRAFACAHLPPLVAIADTRKILRSATRGKGLIAALLNGQQLVTICTRTACCLIATGPQAVSQIRPSKRNQPAKPKSVRLLENILRDAVLFWLTRLHDSAIVSQASGSASVVCNRHISGYRHEHGKTKNHDQECLGIGRSDKSRVSISSRRCAF